MNELRIQVIVVGTEDGGSKTTLMCRQTVGDAFVDITDPAMIMTNLSQVVAAYLASQVPDVTQPKILQPAMVRMAHA